MPKVGGGFLAGGKNVPLYGLHLGGMAQWPWLRRSKEGSHIFLTSHTKHLSIASNNLRPCFHLQGVTSVPKVGGGFLAGGENEPLSGLHLGGMAQ